MTKYAEVSVDCDDNYHTIFTINGKTYQLQDVSIYAYGQEVRSSQDNDLDEILDADDLALVTSDGTFPIDLEAIDGDTYSMLQEMIYPT